MQLACSMRRVLIGLTVLLLATAGCKPITPPGFPTDGPQVEPMRDDGNPRSFGSRCPHGCVMAAAVDPSFATFPLFSPALINKCISLKSVETTRVVCVCLWLLPYTILELNMLSQKERKEWELFRLQSVKLCTPRCVRLEY